MRDIRNDLRERLQAVGAERMELQAKLSALQGTESGLKALLRDEEERLARQSPSLFPPTESINGSGLRELVHKALQEKNRPADLEEIKNDIARTSYDFGDKKPGRAIHFALIGLSQTGVVNRLQDGRWVLGELVQEITH
jgi:hypothetical protein